MNPRPRLFRLSVLAVALTTSASLAIAGQAGASPAAESHTTPAPITVGVICTCSGPFGADILAAEDTYEAWVHAVNKSGGIEGHAVQLTLDDDAGNPGTSVSEAQSLVSKHVDAILDFSIVDQTWASKVQAAKIPVVGGDETEVPFYTSPDFYPEGQTNNSVTYANVYTAKKAGAKNLGDLYCAEAASCQEGVAPIEAAGRKLGVPVVYNAEIAFTAPNYTAQCVAAQQKHVSALFIGDASFVIAKVGTNCYQQGYAPTYVTEGEGFGLSMASADGLRNHLWSEYGTVPFFAHIPAIKAMDTAVDKYYPGLRSNPNEWTQIAAQAWASGLLLNDGVTAGGLKPTSRPTAAEITTGLESLKGDTLQGMAPPLTFAPGKTHPINCWFTGRVQNGVPSVTNGGHVTCQSGT